MERRHNAQQVLADFLRNAAPEMYSLDDEDRIASNRYGLEAAAGAATNFWYPTSIVAEALRGTGLLDVPSVIEGVYTRPELEDIPMTQEWGIRKAGGDPYSLAAIAGSSIVPDPMDLAHLIPVFRAQQYFDGIGSPLADALRAQTQRAQDIIDAEGRVTIDVAQRVYDDTGLQAVQIGDAPQLFYQTPANPVVKSRDELYAMAPDSGRSTHQLRDIYQPDELYDMVPEVGDLPVHLERGPLSMPEMVLMEQNGTRQGGYDPILKEIDYTIFPEYPGAQGVHPLAMLSAALNHSDMLGNSIDEFDQNLRGIEQRYLEHFPMMQAHETEHALQQHFGLGRGTNPIETEAILLADPNPVRFGGDRVEFDQMRHFTFQQMMRSIYNDLQGRDPAQAVGDLPDMLDREIQRLNESINEFVQQNPNLDPRQLASITEDRDKLEAAITHAVGEVDTAYRELADAAMQKFPNEPEKVAEVITDLFPKVRDLSFVRNIERVDSPLGAYQAYLGEAMANAEGRYMTGGDLESPVSQLQVMQEAGRMDPAWLKLRRYQSNYDPSESHAQWLQRRMDEEEIDYHDLVNNWSSKQGN